MEEAKLEKLLIEYIDGDLNEEEKLALEDEFARNPDTLKKYHELKEIIGLMDNASMLEPPSRMTATFNELLENETTASRRGKVIHIQPWVGKAAAAIALLIAGVIGGIIYSNYTNKQTQVAAVHKEKQRIGKVVSMISDSQSAGQRILGVKEALEEEQLNRELVAVLARTLNEDPNINVRMAALQGLRKYYRQPEVKRILLSSLSNQKDPLIQVALIHILVEMDEKDAVDQLRKLAEDQEVIKEVKDEAQMGLLVLS